MASLTQLLFKRFQGSGEKVLIVDDESDIRTLLSIHLKHIGLTPLTAENAEEALEALERGERFALFILDINMPGMNGVELANRIRERPSCKNTPILILTGVMTDEGLQRLERDIHNLTALPKPFESKVIKELVNELLHPRLPEDGE